MNIIPFKVYHTYCPYISMQEPALHSVPDTAWEIVESGGMAFSAELEGRIVGFAGVNMLFSGVAEAWSFLTPAIRNHPFALHRAVKRHMESMVHTKGIRRIQMYVKADFKAGYAWAERLGFFLEGPLYAWGPNNEDYVRFARLFVDHPQNKNGRKT